MLAMMRSASSRHRREDARPQDNELIAANAGYEIE
jgi:hypothetical protein